MISASVKIAANPRKNVYVPEEYNSADILAFIGI